jgi:hypothetical protein
MNNKFIKEAYWVVPEDNGLMIYTQKGEPVQCVVSVKAESSVNDIGTGVVELLVNIGTHEQMVRFINK